jgi:hypothetical protein
MMLTFNPFTIHTLQQETLMKSLFTPFLSTLALSLLPTLASAQTHDWGSEYHTINRPNAMARCPTGYTAEVAKPVCHARSLISPKSQVKSGACPAGTVEEWGLYCTASVTEKSDRMKDVLLRHYNQDLDSNMHLTMGKAQTMNIELPPVFRAYLASTGENMPALPTQLPMQCATGFGAGIASALRCNEAVGIGRGQQAAAGVPPTTQQQITGVPNAAAGAAPTAAAPVAVPAGVPAAAGAAAGVPANPKDALKQGLKGLLSK